MEKELLITSETINKEHQTIGLVEFNLTNYPMGVKNPYRELLKKYDSIVKKVIKNDFLDVPKGACIRQYAQSDFNKKRSVDKAMFIAKLELQERAKLLGADAVIGFRQNVSFHYSGYRYFHIQVYGTAVKYS